MIELKSERLTYKELDYQFLNIINEWHNSKELYGFLVGDYREVSIERDREWIESYKCNGGTQYRFVAFYKSVPIGVIYLLEVDRKKSVGSLGIFIGDTNYRGKGFGKEMFKTLIDFGYNTIKLNELQFLTLKNNNRAISMYKSFGFKEDKSFAKTVVKDGQSVEVIRFCKDNQ